MSSTDEELLKTLPIQPGTTIAGKYRIESLIAVGGMGAVLQAHHEVLDQRVAIKLMRPELADKPEAAQRFLREARAAARIQSDYVARVTDVDLWEGTPFMVMEHLEGVDFSDIVESDDILTVSDAVDLVMQGLAGLEAAHELGVIHRDLKPSNLFLVRRPNKKDRVKVLDFGISKIVGENTGSLKAGADTSSQAVMGTPRYMSPEQVSSARNVDVRTDLWAMGLILYELLTKSYPYEGESAGAILAAILTADLPPIRTLRRDVPLELAGVIEKLADKKRDNRYPTARAALLALAPFASRRIQSLLVDQEELHGPLANTETLGTPERISHVLVAAETSSSADALTKTAMSPEVPALPVGDATDTSMMVLSAPRERSVTPWVIGGVLAVVGCVAAFLWLDEGDTASSASPSPAAVAPTADPSASEPAASEATAASASEPASEAIAASETTAAPEPSTAPSDSAATAASPGITAPARPMARPPARPRPTPKPKDLLNEWD